MADRTRSQTVDEQQRKLEIQIQEFKEDTRLFKAWTAQFIADSRQHRAHQAKQMEAQAQEIAENAAELTSSNSWKIEWQETNNKFYKALNKTRIQQGLPPINHPSLQTENQENSDRTSEVEALTEDFIVFDEVQGSQEEVETSVANAYQIDALLANANREVDASLNLEADSIKRSDEPFLDDKFIEDLDTRSKSSWKVIFDPLDVSSGSMRIESIESRWANLRLNSSSCLRTFSAHKVLVEMADKNVLPMAEADEEIPKGSGQELITVADCNWLHSVIFDPGDGGSEFRVADFRRILAEFFENSTADHVFEEMPKCTGLGYQKISLHSGMISAEVVDDFCSNLDSFKSGAINFDMELKQELISLPFDRGKRRLYYPCCEIFNSWITNLGVEDVVVVVYLDGSGGMDCEMGKDRAINKEALSDLNGL